ncbi:MAG: hypothetical protein HN509_12815 [Halobacteriovoraceae bacterium]|jgi:diacylglycerol kinase family enzyme|nr:hypothetical protein [Halobacteriovoraceae bacterium]MBT5092802.1 hypothetical protein [Halobacteriovoraceae bacterium]
MQNISVYLNQRASNSSFEFWRSKINRSLFRSQLNYRTPGSLEELHGELNKDIENKVDAIISVGGDGTVNTLIQNLANSEIGLLVIPGGTANDLAHELGNEKNIQKVIQCIRNKDSKYIDLIKINNRYMATNGGIGLGGEVASRVNSLRQKFPLFKNLMKFSGKKIYSFLVAQELLGPAFESYDLLVRSKEFSGQVHASAILINNQPVLAGTFEIAPFTSNSDGKFNVTLLTHPSKQRLIRCVLQVASGQIPKNDPHFTTFETESLEIENLNPEKNVKFFGDGEIFENENKWNISIEPSALKVYSRNEEASLLNIANEVTLQ